MILSARGMDMLKRFEGFRNVAYPDVGGVLTIGYGRTAGVTAGERCTLSQAADWLFSDAAIYEVAVNRNVSVPITQNQFDALVSFAFNIGVGAFEESTLLRKLNDKDYDGASLEFLKWTRAGNDPSALLPRRSQERTLFDAP